MTVDPPTLSSFLCPGCGAEMPHTAIYRDRHRETCPGRCSTCDGERTVASTSGRRPCRACDGSGYEPRGAP